MFWKIYDKNSENRVRKRDVFVIEVAILVVNLICKITNAPKWIQDFGWLMFAMVLFGLIVMFIVCLLDQITRIMQENKVLKKFLDYFLKICFEKKDDDKIERKEKKCSQNQ